MTDVYSPVPELNLLKEFEDGCDEAYAAWAWMDDFGEMEFLDDPRLKQGLLRFAQANLSGSIYALWKCDDGTDLASLPVVLLGDEGGIHVVARNLREFFQVLGSLKGDLACDLDEVFETDDAELPGQAQYLAWLGRHFGLAAPEDPWDIIQGAQEDLAQELAEWISLLSSRAAE
ncbi:hypothetical protein ACIBI9_48555 [Nonomuraea sp. NPDC050451]|uniref:hypothetical protein n=1 Tax=Nonomuraea sp. NPDC050451 TaxID=3364364 RepID=UPI0037B447FC